MFAIMATMEYADSDPAKTSSIVGYLCGSGPAPCLRRAGSKETVVSLDGLQLTTRSDFCLCEAKLRQFWRIVGPGLCPNCRYDSLLMSALFLHDFSWVCGFLSLFMRPN